MVETTALVREPDDDAEAPLLCAKMNAALIGLAKVESVTVDRTAGVVFVDVHFPDDVPEAERDRRRVRVQSALTVVAAGALAAAGLVLAPINPA